MSNRLAPWRLDERIVGPGIPQVGQVGFDAMLRRHGLRLAWNPRRRVFLVWRDRGPTTWPMWYPFDMGASMFPLNEWLAKLVIDGAALADSFQREDAKRAMDIFARRADDVMAKERGRWIAERMPDFVRDMMRTYNLLVDGVRASRPVFADLGSIGPRS